MNSETYNLELLEKLKDGEGKELGSWVCSITPIPKEGAEKFILDEALVPHDAKQGSVLAMTITLKASEPVIIYACGPSSKTCNCACPDGPCEHVFDGPWMEFENSEGGGGGSATCSRCGMSAIDHSLWVCE